MSAQIDCLARFDLPAHLWKGARCGSYLLRGDFGVKTIIGFTEFFQWCDRLAGVTNPVFNFVEGCMAVLSRATARELQAESQTAPIVTKMRYTRAPEWPNQNRLAFLNDLSNSH